MEVGEGEEQGGGRRRGRRGEKENGGRRKERGGQIGARVWRKGEERDGEGGGRERRGRRDREEM